MNLDCAKCETSLSGLEKYRDDNGFIDLDKLNIVFPAESRERMGNDSRFKNWVDFSGTQVLVKQEILLGNEKNYGIYAELIVEEMYKQMGLETAHYDLVKINGESGLLSVNILKEGEEMYSLDSIAVDIETNEDYPDIVDFYDIQKGMIENFKKQGLSKDDIKEQLYAFQNRMVMGAFTLASDMHSENISYIYSKQEQEDGFKVEIAPAYDNESCLMLDLDEITMKAIVASQCSIKDVSDFSDFKIAVLDNEDMEGKALWAVTLNELLDCDNTYDFMMDCYEKLNINEAIHKVEERIGAPLPDICKKIATKAFNARKKEIDKVMCQEYS